MTVTKFHKLVSFDRVFTQFPSAILWGTVYTRNMYEISKKTNVCCWQEQIRRWKLWQMEPEAEKRDPFAPTKRRRPGLHYQLQDIAGQSQLYDTKSDLRWLSQCTVYTYTVSQKITRHSTLQNINRFSKFLNCWSRHKIVYKVIITCPTSP